MEFTQAVVGVPDLQRAALAEARRFMRQAKGDRGVATRLVFDRLVELGWITAEERDVLVRMYQVGAPKPVKAVKAGGAAPQRVRVAARAVLDVQGMYDGLIARGGTSAVALALAAGAAGSFEAEPGDDGTTVVYAKSTRSYQGILGGAGAIIGGALGGAPGAAIGGAIGGVIGTIVDDCKD